MARAGRGDAGRRHAPPGPRHDLRTVNLADPGIPTLEKALDPVVLGQYLPEVLPSEWGAIQDLRLQILKHHPGLRCTVEVTLGTTRGCHALRGKVHAVDRADIYEATQRIWSARRSGVQADATAVR